MNRGFFGIAVYQPKTRSNVGTLWRTADLMGASFLATIGLRYKTQKSDTTKAARHTPLFEYETWQDFKSNVPRDCLIVGVEMAPRSLDLASFSHPERAVYLLGAEDHGLPEHIQAQCHTLVRMRGSESMNVAVAGSIVVYHREALR